MEDIAPELLKKIQDDFQEGFDNSKKISEIQKLIETGKATYADAQEFAIEVGELLSEAYQKNLSSATLPDGKMYYNIAKRILEPTLKNDYEVVSETSVKVQEILNKEAGIGIKAIQPELNQDRIDGVIDIVSGKDQYDDIAYMLKEPIVNFSQSIVDATVRANADFQWKAGLSPKIVRTVTGGCCEWCAKLAGTYEYSKVSNTGNDVFRRHKNCRCLVTYHPGDGWKQNVHSKEWSMEEERDKIKVRKMHGLHADDDAVLQNIRENVISKQNISKVVERQQIHRVSTGMYEQRKADLLSKGQYGPSYVTISDEEILNLVKKYSGTGRIKINRKGDWNSQETILTNDEIIGVVVDNRNGNSAETSVFKIHYGKDGIHIVPDYPSKKR